MEAAEFEVRTAVCISMLTEALAHLTGLSISKAQDRAEMDKLSEILALLAKINKRAP